MDYRLTTFCTHFNLYTQWELPVGEVGMVQPFQSFGTPVFLRTPTILRFPSCLLCLFSWPHPVIFFNNSYTVCTCSVYANCVSNEKAIVFRPYRHRFSISIKIKSMKCSWTINSPHVCTYGCTHLFSLSMIFIIMTSFGKKESYISERKVIKLW